MPFREKAWVALRGIPEERTREFVRWAFLTNLVCLGSSHRRVTERRQSLTAEGLLMKRLLGICALALLFCLPCFAQAQRMSPEDQDHFNSDYSRWLQDRQSNDRDDMISMEQRMQDLMNRYAIPSGTPYGEVAAQNTAPGYEGGYRDHRYAGTYNQLSPDDQRKFNEEYRKW